MKKAALFFALAFAVLAPVAANEQRLVGSWTDLHDDMVIVFNADGTVSGRIFFRGANGLDFAPTRWAAAGDRLVVFTPNVNRAVRSFRISGDGRTLIIEHASREWASAWRRN